MGNLDIWAGLATGLESGLSNYMKIRQIQNQEERDRLAEQRFQKGEERALRGEDRARIEYGQKDTLFKQAQDEHARLNAPVHKVGDVLASTGLDEEGQKAVSPYLARVGITGPNQMISRKQMDEAVKSVLDNDEVKSIVNTNRLRIQNQRVDDAQKLVDSTMTPEGGITLGYENAKRRLQDAIAQRDANPASAAALARQGKEQEMRLADERAAREKRGQDLTERQVVTGEKAQISTEQAQRDAAAAQRRTDEYQQAHLKMEREKIQATLKQHLSDDRWKIIVGASPKTKQTVTDAAGNTSIVETPDIVKGMEAARKLRPDLFKDIPAPEKEKINWSLVWPQLEIDIQRNPGKAAAVAQRLKEDPSLGMSAEVLAGPLFADKPNLRKALKPFFPSDKPPVKGNAPARESVLGVRPGSAMEWIGGLGSVPTLPDIDAGSY